MAIRMTGMMSGLDTDAIIKELMSAQSMKKTKIEQKKTKAEWKQEKWAELNKKIYALYTKQVSKMKLQGAYLTKKVTSSNEDAVTATATSSAAMGSHTLEVKQLASSQYMTSGKIKEGSTSKTTLEELGVTAGTTIRITAKDKIKDFEVTDKTTVNDFVKALQDAGLNASFDEKQGRFFISSKESGEKNAFSIVALGANDSELGQAKNQLATSLGSDLTALNSFYSDYATALENNNQEKIAELTNNLIESAKENKKSDLTEEETNNIRTVYINTLDEKTTNTYSQYKDENGNFQANIEDIEIEGKKISDIVDELLRAEAEAKPDIYTDEVAIQLYIQNQDNRNNKIQSIYEETLTKEINEKADDYLEEETTKNAIETAVESRQDEIDEAGVAMQTAIERYNSAVSADYGMGVKGDLLKGLGLLKNDPDNPNNPNYSGVSIIEATDAIIVLDGAELKDTSNSFSVAGINLELKNETTGKVSLNVTSDTDAVYNSFKEFIKEYNSVLEEMNTLYGAASSKGYEPLTDEEKEAMSEEQIELWEKKIKDSLLRRDSTLSSLTSAMRTVMQTSIKASDGKTYSLASLGVMTSSDYTEKGLLHIYGDEDDEDYGTEENKLKKALQENPDIVAEVLSKIVTELSSTMADKMKGTEVSSALTFYNDKEMKNQIKDYEDEITRWEDKLLDLEDRYYKQFSAMESALAKLNSQSSYLSSMLGTSM